MYIIMDAALHIMLCGHDLTHSNILIYGIYYCPCDKVTLIQANDDG